MKLSLAPAALEGLQLVPDGVFLVDREGTCLWANPVWCARLGVDLDQVQGHLVGDWLPDADRAAAELSLAAVWEGGRKQAVWHFVDYLGRSSLLAVHLSALDERAALATVREQAPAAVRSSLLDGLGQAVVTADLEGSIQTWNRGATELYGWRTEEAAGRNLDVLLRTTWESAPRAEVMACLADGGSWSGHVTRRRRDGSSVQVRDSLTAWRDAADGLVIVSVSSDAAPERAEASARERVTAIRTARRLARELATELVATSTVLAALADGVEAGDVARTPESLLELARRLEGVERRLSAFGSVRTVRGDHMDVQTAVEEAVAALGTPSREVRVLVVDTPPEALGVAAGRETVSCVLGAVLGWAVATCIAQAVVEVSWSLAPVTPGQAGWMRLLSPGPYVRLTLRVPGGAIAAADLAPDLTPPVSGSAPGLATAFAAALDAGGWVHLEPGPEGRGASAQVWLPRAVDQGEGDDDAPPPAVLVVDDNPTVVTAARAALAPLGFPVLDAPSAEAALALVLGARTPVNLLVVDVIMPGMSGPDLARSLLAVLPNLKVMYLCSVPANHPDLQDLVLTGHPLLAKPFRPDDILEAAVTALEFTP